MSNSISGFSGTAAYQRFDPTQMKAQREQALSKLKESDPDLAAKMEKIDTRMDELRDSGVSGKDAKQTIDKEFGQLSDKELGELREAMGSSGMRGPGGMGGAHRMQGPPPGPPPTDSSSSTDSADSTKSLDDLLKELSSALNDSSDSSSSDSSSSTSSTSSSSTAKNVWSDFQQLAQLIAQKYGSSAQSGASQSYFGSQGFVA